MYQGKSAFTKLAMNTIYKELGKPEPFSVESDKLLGEKLGCFVTLHEKDGRLRGCIGTISPYRENLFQEIIGNALSAAFNDSRFSPVTKEEIDNLTFSVDILSPIEPVKSLSELDPKKYGLIIRQKGRRGVLLPDLEGVDTVDKQISIVLRKAGISTRENLEYFKFTSTRYF